MNRRQALKTIGLSPVAASLLLGSSGVATQAEASSDAKGKIVIVGAGTGGIITLSRLRRVLKNPDITIISPNETHLYQPGQVFMAAGLYEYEDIVGDNNDFIPDDVEWIKDKVTTFDPDNNRVITRGGKEVKYDYLVVATGISSNWNDIEGLTADKLGKDGITSVYLNDTEKGTADGGIHTWEWFNQIKADAKAGKKPRVILTQPGTPIKCGGAPQKILYLCNDHLKKEGLSAEFIFATAKGKLFGLKEIDASLHKVQERYGNIENKFGHDLKSVDTEKKTATFKHKYEIQGEYDEDIEEYDVIEKEEEVTLDYDYIHIVPPMGAKGSISYSQLAWQTGSAKGCMEVDRYTLQHRRYKNVFGIGDVCALPYGKTGGSARHHGPIVVGNLIAQMEGRELTEKFDGYTVCPLKTQYGKIILAEFNYEGLAPSFPLDPAVPRYTWWAFDLYMLKPMYWNLMMRGLM